MDDYEALIKLGDMMGDGLHYEEPWISKEYSKVAKRILHNDPEYKAIQKRKRIERNKQIDEIIKQKEDKCSLCNGDLKQVRKGSYVVKCINCGMKFKYQKRKK